MATLYFSDTSTDWSNPSSWFTALSSSGGFSGAAGRIPNSSDTAIICGNISNISGAFTAPAVLQLGTTTPYVYQGYWIGDGFFTAGINFNLPLVNLVNNGLNNGFWAETGGVNTYAITIMNVYGNSFFEGTATIGTANFYDHSLNGRGDEGGNIIGNANFFNFSTNYSDGENNGYITGNAVFNDSSLNAGFDNLGNVIGIATFNGNSSSGNHGNLGTVQGTAIFNSVASIQNTLAGV